MTQAATPGIIPGVAVLAPLTVEVRASPTVAPEVRLLEAVAADRPLGSARSRAGPDR